MTKTRVKAAGRTTAPKRATRSRIDFDALETAFDSTPRGRRAIRKIKALQRRLKRSVDESAWRIYLELEEAVNAKYAYYLDYLYTRLRAR